MPVNFKTVEAFIDADDSTDEFIESIDKLLSTPAEKYYRKQFGEFDYAYAFSTKMKVNLPLMKQAYEGVDWPNVQIFYNNQGYSLIVLFTKKNSNGIDYYSNFPKMSSADSSNDDLKK